MIVILFIGLKAYKKERKNKMKKYEVRYGIRENEKIVSKKISFDCKKDAKEFANNLKDTEYWIIRKNF